MTDPAPTAPAKPPEILTISSNVVRGAVGNRATTAILENLGAIVWALPTLTVAHHFGHGPVTPMVVGEDQIDQAAADLDRTFGLARLAAIVTGYFATAGQVRAVAGLIARIKTANPAALYLCDPVLGDDGRLYVGADIAPAIRDDLLPLADMATPNRFECAWLAGTEPAGARADPDALIAMARGLPPQSVVVTSVPGLTTGTIGNLLVTEDAAVLAEHRTVTSPVKGTGDAFAALYLARTLERDTAAGPPDTLSAASAGVCDLVAAAERLGLDELPVGVARQAVARPRTRVTLRRLQAEPRRAGTGGAAG